MIVPTPRSVHGEQNISGHDPSIEVCRAADQDGLYHGVSFFRFFFAWLRFSCPWDSREH